MVDIEGGNIPFSVKHGNLGKGLNSDISDLFTSGISDLRN